MKKKIQRKHISDLEPEALIPNDKIRNQYKGNKIRITLWIEYLKSRTLCLRFESLQKQDRSCLASMILVDQISQTLVWDSNHSTSKIDHVELEWFYMQPKLHRVADKRSHWLKKSTNASFNIFSKSAVQIQHRWLYIASKWNY